MTISPYYQDQLVAKHQQGVWGNRGHTWAPEVRDFALNMDCRTILDYGCGQGTLAPNLQGFTVAEYDPGVVGKQARPSPADLVVCTDVLEHIEPQHLEAVIEDILTLAQKAAFLVIWCKRARETLPDGRNAHLIVQPPLAWQQEIMKFARPRGFHGLTNVRQGNKVVVIWLAK